jgi:DNA-binding MarR family transcriptional regulator
MLTIEPQQIAHQILETVPLVMRHLWAEMRQDENFLIVPHFRLLWILRHHACSLSELAEKQAVSLPTMSNSVSILEDKGWVARNRSDEDRRKVVIELTDAGRAVLEEAGRHAEARISQLLASIHEHDREVLSAGLTILREIFIGDVCGSQLENQLAGKEE